MKSMKCYDVENDCTGCDQKEGCSLWENTQVYVERIKQGYIGEIHRPDGSVQLIKKDTPL